MRESHITAELTRHFFRRFFENDLLDSDGDTFTTVARALAIVAAPGLMFAFFLQNAYPQRSSWGRVEDQYFFVLFSFVVMTGLALFEWETLFPERLDFLILTPLPLRPRQLLIGKAAALGCVLLLFLLASNLLGIFMLPIVSKGVFWRMVWAQSIAVASAGFFGAFLVMSVGGLLLCVLPPAIFRRLTPGLQIVGTAALALLIIHYARFGDELSLLLAQPGKVTSWIPTFWFLGLFEHLLRGSAAESFAPGAARRALEALPMACCIAFVLYPLAWVRMQRMAVQGEATRGRVPMQWWRATQARWVHAPAERAVFSFLAKTMSRNSRYHSYLAIYAGLGLALSMACAVGFQHGPAGVHLALSPFGLRAVLPLWLFWTIAGLRIAFAFPQNLPARWIFRITGAEAQACARATRRWTRDCGMVWVCVFASGLGALGFGWRALLVQVVWGISFCVALVEGFFVAQQGAPFTQPRSPGKTNLPAVLTLYIGVLPPLMFVIAWAEMHMEQHLWQLLIPALIAAVLRFATQWIRERLIWFGEETEGADGEFQLLGLTGELRA